MGTLRDRLERMSATGEITTGKSVRRRVEEIWEQPLFPGEEQVRQTLYGKCYFREIAFPAAYRHGSGPLAELLLCRGGDLTLPAGDPALAAFVPAEALFVDIETTGLSGGTGTLVILIGMCWYREGKFFVRQYFLSDPAREKAMLAHAGEMLERFSGLVTFNGRTFDLPLIRTRQILAGLPQAAPENHLDLLRCARRLWKGRLDSCSLKSLEEKVLELWRTDDIPGAEIPELYFNFLRRGETERLRAVFEHNVMDLLSMVRLLAVVAQAAAGSPPHPADNFALGRLYAGQGAWEKAIECYRKAAACGNLQVAAKALLHLSLLYKRQGRWPEAAGIWAQMVRAGWGGPFPLLELAKYYEHREKNYRAALAMTEYLLCMRSRPGQFAGQLHPAALLYRRERLRRKAEGSSPGCKY
ncbi:MAG: hypothetical protein GX167_09815 [Firmicutes bacterium]|nr:hypothetical protein [Bacillota bacterium]